MLRGLSAEATRKTGEQIVASVRRLDGKALGFPGPLTCSLGAVWSERPAVGSAEELLAAADQLMYKAKRNGKNRCFFGLLTEPYDSVQHGDGNAPRTAESTRRSQEAGDGKTNRSTLEELLAIARQLHDCEVDTFVGIRKQERKKLTLPCAVHHFTEAGTDMPAEQAVARNLSTGGIGLLIARPLARGEAVEVVLDRGSSKLFLAGLVSYCRHIVGSVHDVGIQFVAHSVTPIISGDTPEAVQGHEWVAQAVRAEPDRKRGSQARV